MSRLRLADFVGFEVGTVGDNRAGGRVADERRFRLSATARTGRCTSLDEG